jgi:hypothetical protein
MTRDIADKSYSHLRDRDAFECEEVSVFLAADFASRTPFAWDALPDDMVLYPTCAVSIVVLALL